MKFKTTAGNRRGLGPVGKGNIYGLLAHAMIAVDADTQARLGLVDGDVWNRPGIVETSHHKRNLEDRESSPPPSQGQAWPASPATRCSPLRRAFLWRAPPRSRFRPACRIAPNAPRRWKCGSARWKSVARAANGTGPPGFAGTSLPKSVRLRLVDIREIDPPEGAEAIHWRLLTTHEVADVAAAWRIVAWYRMRWVIEQLFRVMKSQGLKVEDSQLSTAKRLIKLVAITVKAACLDILLVQERDGKHGQPASIAFPEAEIDTIEALSPILEGKTERQRNPHPPRSLASAAWVMARLGGWNCYYAPPGPITMRRGRERFRAMHEGRLLGSIMEQDVRIG